MTLRAPVLIALFLAATAVSACGKVGDLERPAPLWGPKERAKAEAEKRAASEAANKPSRPGSLQEVRDPASSSATIRQQPIAGTNDPFGKPPQ